MHQIHILKGFILTAAFISLASAMTAQAQSATPTWTELGGSASFGGISGTEWASQLPRIAFGPDGFPVVVWYESNGTGFNVYVRRWNGTSWIELGGSGSGAGISGQGFHQAWGQDVAVDSSGNVFVVYQKAVNGTWEIHLLRWNGQAWGELGGSGSGGGISNLPGWSTRASIAIDASGNPWVAWQEEGSGDTPEILLRRWDGSAWVGVGGSAGGGGISNTPQAASLGPRLAFDPSGNPVVAWSELIPGSPVAEEVYVRRWNGTTWEELGGSATGHGISNAGAGSSRVGSLVIDSSGHPLVVWYRAGLSPEEVFLRRWNGSAWVELGRSASGNGISGIRLDPTYGFEMFCRGATLGLDLADNPIVTWSEGTAFTPYQVRVRRWNGDSWVGLEGTDGTAGLDAAAPNFPTTASMGVNKYGDVFVAWGDGPAGDQEIYLKHWRNARVTELGQIRSDGTTPMPVGITTTDNKVMLRGRISRDLVAFPLKFQVEIRPLGQAFTGVPTVETDFYPTQSMASVMITGLVLGGWRWRARTIESTGFVSAWESFGDNPDGYADFWVVAAMPNEETSTSGGNGGGSKGCGLLGIEAPLLMIALAWIRRKRAVHR